MKIIEYYVKHVYGTPLCYCKDPKDAELVKQITGKKTIDGRMQTHIQNLTGGLVKFQQVMWPLIMLMFALSAHAEINTNQAIRAVVGEAASEPYQCQVAICAVIRNRGSLQGVYGLRAKHIDSEPAWVFKRATKAWNESANTDPTHGCRYWGGFMDDDYFRNTLHKTPVMTIGHTRFYK